MHVSSGPGWIHCRSLFLYPSYQRYFITVHLNTLISLKGWQPKTALSTRCAMNREERIPTLNLQHFATDFSKSAHTRNVRILQFSPATMLHLWLLEIQPERSKLFFFFDGTVIRGYSQKIRGCSLECPGLTTRLEESGGGRRWIEVVSSDKCTYCKSLWIKAAAKSPKCKCSLKAIVQCVVWAHLRWGLFLPPIFLQIRPTLKGWTCFKYHCSSTVSGMSYMVLTLVHLAVVVFNNAS
jgi:hypothetical protein